MPRFRKRPAEVEARRVPTDDSYITVYLDESLRLAGWCGGTCHMMNEDDEASPSGLDVTGPHIVITDPVNEGAHAALPGDWIIQGVNGEFYGCKPDIFEATYEFVDEALDDDQSMGTEGRRF